MADDEKLGNANDSSDYVTGSREEKFLSDKEKVQGQVTVAPPDEPTGTGNGAEETEPELEYVPDGGREAWIVVLGSSLALFASAGMVNAYVSYSSSLS